jgi:hypothetical protein
VRVSLFWFTTGAFSWVWDTEVDTDATASQRAAEGVLGGLDTAEIMDSVVYVLVVNAVPGRLETRARGGEVAQRRSCPQFMMHLCASPTSARKAPRTQLHSHRSACHCSLIFRDFVVGCASTAAQSARLRHYALLAPNGEMAPERGNPIVGAVVPEIQEPGQPPAADWQWRNTSSNRCTALGFAG